MSDAPPQDAKAGAPEPRTRLSMRRLLSAAPGRLGATATLITGVLGAVFLLLPSWRPLSRDKIRASVEVPAIETAVTLEDWAERQYPGNPTGTLRRLLGHRPSTDDLSTRGLVVYVKLDADGFKRRTIRLRARVYDAGTRTFDESIDPDIQIYPEARELRLDAPSRSSVQLLLLRDFSDVGGTYFVRVEAYDDSGILAYDDSATIGPPKK